MHFLFTIKEYKKKRNRIGVIFSSLRVFPLSIGIPAWKFVYLGEGVVASKLSAFTNARLCGSFQSFLSQSSAQFQAELPLWLILMEMGLCFGSSVPISQSVSQSTSLYLSQWEQSCLLDDWDTWSPCLQSLPLTPSYTQLSH